MPPTGRPDAIREVILTFEDGGWLHVSAELTAARQPIAVSDALLRVRIAPTDGQREALRLETSVGAPHFLRHGDDARLDIEIPCNLRGRVAPGSTCVDAHVAIVVSDSAPLEATTKFSVNPRFLELADQRGTPRR